MFTNVYKPLIIIYSTLWKKKEIILQLLCKNLLLFRKSLFCPLTKTFEVPCFSVLISEIISAFFNHFKKVNCTCCCMQ